MVLEITAIILGALVVFFASVSFIKRRHATMASYRFYKTLIEAQRKWPCWHMEIKITPRACGDEE